MAFTASLTLQLMAGLERAATVIRDHEVGQLSEAGTAMLAG